MGLIGLRDLFWLILSNFIWGSQHFHESSVSHHPNVHGPYICLNDPPLSPPHTYTHTLEKTLFKAE